MVLIEQEYVKVSYDEKFQLSIIEWKADCSSAEYREVFLKILKFSETKSVKINLSDVRKQGKISEDDQKWFEEIAMPLAIGKGLLATAVIFDGSPHKKYYINIIVKATQQFDIPLKIFTKRIEALEWLHRFVIYLDF